MLKLSVKVWAQLHWSELFLRIVIIPAFAQQKVQTVQKATYKVIRPLLTTEDNKSKHHKSLILVCFITCCMYYALKCHHWIDWSITKQWSLAALPSSLMIRKVNKKYKCQKQLKMVQIETLKSKEQMRRSVAKRRKWGQNYQTDQTDQTMYSKGILRVRVKGNSKWEGTFCVCEN